MTPWLLERMACPRHRTSLSSEGAELACASGCRFPLVDGVPVMLLEEATQTMDLARASLRQSKEPNADGGLYVDSIGLTPVQRRSILDRPAEQGTIDPVVSFLVGATNGLAYVNQVGRLKEYPIPQLRLPPGQGHVFLDLGCSWGRWCAAAGKAGYKVVGIDPSLGAVMAARRMTRQIGVDAEFVVGDARFLPFKAESVDSAFSYSVLQHLDKGDVASVLAEIGRVLQRGGSCTVQMPTKFGLRCLYHQLRRGFRGAKRFEVRYWSLPELKTLFTERVGRTSFSVDCYFGIGLQYCDLRLMSPLLKVVVLASELLRRLSRLVPHLVWAADSVYVSSVKTRSPSAGSGREAR